MAIELIAEEYAKFRGYLTRVRVPFKVKNGNSDFDVLGYNIKKRETLVVECKAWGSNEDYLDYSTPARKRKIREILGELIEHWGYFCNSDLFKMMGYNRKLNQVWIVIPGYVEEDFTREVSEEFGKDINIKLIPIHSLLLQLMRDVKLDLPKKRTRYANPALEFCRWLVRGYDNEAIDLQDIEVNLTNEKARYESLRMRYVNSNIRMVTENAKEKETRIKVLKALSMSKDGKTKKSAIEKINPNLNLSQDDVKNGLSTWKDQGIILCEGDMYWIAEPFVSLVRDWFRKNQGASAENTKELGLVK